jgi:hypothetical protein
MSACVRIIANNSKQHFGRLRIRRLCVRITPGASLSAKDLRIILWRYPVWCLDTSWTLSRSYSFRKICFKLKRM